MPLYDEQVIFLGGYVVSSCARDSMYIFASFEKNKMEIEHFIIPYSLPFFSSCLPPSPARLVKVLAYLSIHSLKVCPYPNSQNGTGNLGWYTRNEMKERELNRF